MAPTRRRRRGRTQPATDELQEVIDAIRRNSEIPPHVKLGIYGVNGSQKTRFCATAHGVVIAAGERTTRSIVGSGARIFPINHWDDYGKLYWALKSGKLRRVIKACAIDTVTMMHVHAMDLVLAEAEDRDPGREKKKPTQNDYGRANKLVEGMLFAYRDLPMHVILTAQERTIRDSDGDTVEQTIELPEGARKAFLAAVDIVGHMEPKTVRGKSVSRMRTSKTDTQFFNKDHTGNLPAVLVRPTMPKIIKAWETASPTEE